MSSDLKIQFLVLVAIFAASVLLIRWSPFLSRKTVKPGSRYESVLPAAIMILLVLYSLEPTKWMVAPYGIPELACLAMTVSMHLWRRNFVLSVFASSLLYLLWLNREALI